MPLKTYLTGSIQSNHSLQIFKSNCLKNWIFSLFKMTFSPKIEFSSMGKQIQSHLHNRLVPQIRSNQYNKNQFSLLKRKSTAKTKFRFHTTTTIIHQNKIKKFTVSTFSFSFQPWFRNADKIIRAKLLSFSLWECGWKRWVWRCIWLATKSGCYQTY